jgi:predicted dehydrogenase
MINIAQIGVGYWGPNLLQNLIANKDVNLKTVVDLSAERRHFVDSNYPDVLTTDEISDVLDDASIHAIVISTPVETHYDLAIQALNAGKHILVEKPMATSS